MNQIMLTEHLNAVVLAGPGSGKTTALIKRIHHLIASGVPPDKIAAISYTVSASAEIARRLADENSTEIGYVGTLHGMCVRLLRSHFAAFSVLSEEEARLVFDEVCAEQKCGSKEKRLASSFARHSIGQKVIDTQELWSTAEARVTGCYYRRMRELGVLSFDAILHYAIRILVSPTKPEIPWTHILVDEAQDMASPDAHIYELLNPKSLWLFGDPDQAIFSFRGGNVECLESFARRMPALVMEQNHRSNEDVCKAADLLIANNANRTCRKSMVPMGKMKGVVMVLNHNSDTDEVKWIGDRLLNSSKVDTIGLKTDNVAVLTRTNALADAIAASLEHQGVLVQKRSKTILPADWRWAKLLIGVAVNPTEAGMANYLCRRLGAEGKKMAAEAWAQGRKLADAIEAVSLTKVDDVLEAQRISVESRMLFANILEGCKKLDPASIMMEIDRREHDTVVSGKGVHVGTMHSAKGREWDVVFLPACEEGIVPSTRGVLEEERRLMFVAITRAKALVFASWAKQRMMGAGILDSNRKPSRFLFEMRGEDSSCHEPEAE